MCDTLFAQKETTMSCFHNKYDHEIHGYSYCTDLFLLQD